jgi:hypothetical protein
MSVRFEHAKAHSIAFLGYENLIAYDPEFKLPIGCWVCLSCGYDFYGSSGLTLHKGDIPIVDVELIEKCALSRVHPETSLREVNAANGFKNTHLVYVMGPNFDLNMYKDSYPFPRQEVLALRELAKKSFESQASTQQENTWII